jgi:enamine deaminase RidA (YjgF/YER057c/UK114 family)
VRAGGLLLTSGHTSIMLGRIGDELTVEQGRGAAREAALRMLASVREMNGTLEGLTVVQLSVFVRSTPEFTRHGEVADGASELLREVFGGDMLPARRALGMASLPRGAAVELDAILESRTHLR